MADLWATLGYDQLAVDAAARLGASSDINVIQGPPGVGKSLLAKGIGALWESAGGRVVLVEGDSTHSEVALHPFRSSMELVQSDVKLQASALAALARVGEILLGTGGALTASVEALKALQASQMHQRVVAFDKREQEILSTLERFAKKAPLLLVADNLHWWDSPSLEFLARLRDARTREAFSFTRSLRVLGVETIEPYEDVVQPQSHDALLKPSLTHFVPIDAVPREGFEDVLMALGAGERPTAEIADLIHKLSGGHLVLASRCAARLRTGEADRFLAATSSDEFVQRLVSERVRTMGTGGKEALEMLQVAAVTGLHFRRDELVCATGVSEANAAQLLRYCSDENIIDLKDEGGKFVHNLYREHFLETIGKGREGIHESLGECLRKLTPAEYESRCINALSAGIHDEAAALAVQAALQRLRDGLPWRNLSPTVIEAMNMGDLCWAVEQFEIALEHLSNYRSGACLQALAELPHDLPECLMAEADYLQAICLMTTRSESDRVRAELLLESWSEYVDIEPELGLRLMRLRLYHSALQVDKVPGLRLENQIRQILRRRSRSDPAAKDALYIMDRCAGMIHAPERAVDMNQRAVQYFESTDPGAVIRRPVEYYLALVNWGANLMGIHRFGDAREVHKRIECLIESYEPGVFPRLDYPKTNAVLANYRLQSVTLDEAVCQQTKIVATHKVPDDPFFVENALAVYLALQGSNEHALEIFDALIALLAGRGDPEPSLDYMLRSNRCAVRFVGGDREEARREWAELAEVVAAIPYVTRSEMVDRHRRLAEVMNATSPLSAAEFDDCLAERGASDGQRGRGFWMPAVEWWR